MTERARSIEERIREQYREEKQQDFESIGRYKGKRLRERSWCCVCILIFSGWCKSIELWQLDIEFGGFERVALHCKSMGVLENSPVFCKSDLLDLRKSLILPWLNVFCFFSVYRCYTALRTCSQLCNDRTYAPEICLFVASTAATATAYKPDFLKHAGLLKHHLKYQPENNKTPIVYAITDRYRNIRETSAEIH